MPILTVARTDVGPECNTSPGLRAPLPCPIFFNTGDAMTTIYYHSIQLKSNQLNQLISLSILEPNCSVQQVCCARSNERSWARKRF